MKENYSITKSAVELYRIRMKDSTWADITLDCGEEAGRISIASDYGDWGYYWGACGCSFKKFLVHLDIQYTAGKFSCNKFFDHDATLASYRKSVEESDLSKGGKAALYKEIDSLSDYGNENEFVAELRYEKVTLMRFFDYPPLIRGIDPHFKRFWNEIWPVFLRELAKEEPIDEQSITTDCK